MCYIEYRREENRMICINDKVHKVSIRNRIQINSALKPLVELFGLNYFYYSRVSNSGLYSSFSNNIEWNKYWFDQGFHLKSFYFLQPQNYQYGLTISLPFFEDQFFHIQSIAQTKFNINYVIEITKKTNSGIESYGFSTDKFNHSTLKQYFTDLPFLKLFFKNFREKNSDIFRQLDENQINIANAIGPKFFESSSVINTFDSYKSLISIGFDIYSDLSKREKQVCKKITKGKSANEIADLFGLSKRTIESYIENIKIKLNCFTKSDLLEKCLDLESIGYLEVCR